MPGRKCRVRDLVHRNMQGRRKVFKERSAAGSACRDNMKPASRLSVAFSHINERTAGNLKGRTFIRRVKRIQDLSVFSKQDKFCSRASGINSQPCGDVLVFFNSGMAGFCFFMSSAELMPLFFRGKKRRGLFSAVLCYDGLFLIQNLKQLFRRTVFSPRRNIYGGDCRASS